jgi:phosphate transport system substrate-binding protein
MAGWTCDGIAKDNKPHPEQHTSGRHEPYENFGKDCVICGLSKEAIGGGSNAPVKAIAAILTGMLLLIAAGISYFIFKPCPSGQQKISGTCVAVNPTPSSTPIPSPTGSTTATSTLSPSLTVTPAASASIYRTFAEIPNVPAMKVRYGGSTSFAPLRSPQIEVQIEQAHPGFELIYTEPSPGEKPGSGSGIRMLLEGQLSVAQSSRSLKPEEFEEARTRGFSLEPQAVAIDGIALYVHPQLSIPGLSASQVREIYTGTIRNWSEVGGPDLEIIPFSRDPEDGGTPEYFQENILDKEDFAPSVQPYVRDTTDSIRRVASTVGGIGYATASEVCNQQTVHPLPISREVNQDFVDPCDGDRVNQTAFANATYPITRELFVIIRRDGGLKEQAGVAYVNLLLSDEGQQLINQAGLVRIR